MNKLIWALMVALLVCAPAFSGKKLKYNDKEKDFLKKVDLIITLQERKIFRKRITSHHERDRFIELFWAKRDPDLTDNVNPFRTEWMARYDYVITHFNDHEFSQTSLNQSDLFLLLGPPTAKSHLVDLSLMGPGYRNRYTRYPPELWVYENVGYDYQRSKLKVQFIPTSAFGEFVAITDRLTDHFLRNIKFKFIVNPDLEEPPLNAISSADYQAGTVELGGESRETLINVMEPEKEDDLFEPLTPANRAAMPQAPPPVVAKTESAAPRAAPPTAAPPPDRPKQTLVPPAPPKSEALAVPSTLSDAKAFIAATSYQSDAGNSAGLVARTSYFKSGSEKRLLLGRVGFPLNNIDFTFRKDQYVAPFQLDYHLIGRSGKALHGDSIRTEVALPSKRVLQKRTTWYSNEFAIILNGDRFTFKAQLTDLGSGKVSYFEMPIEVPPLRGEPHATSLVFMDPNVNPQAAKFNIRNKPYNLRLTHDFVKGDRIYPVTELINISSQDQIATIQIQAMDEEGALAHTWDLYTGEMTDTGHGSFLIHPILNARHLESGSYTLRVEVELSSGDLLLSESHLTLE